jgi:hypothetical protein
MGEKISWAEGAQQLAALQGLMMEAAATEYPEVGLLIQSDEPELLIDYLNRAKQKDPILQDMVISIKSSGVLIYRPFVKRIPENGEENRSTDDSPPRSDL